MTERRRCMCGIAIETEADRASIEHAVRAHQAEPEHRAFVALQREQVPTYQQVRGELLTPPMRLA